MEQLTIPYPTWYILGCLFLGLAFAGALYWREKNLREQQSWLPAALGILRGLAVALIAFFLLSPLLKYLRTESRPPVVVLAQDASESVGATLTTSQRTTYQQQLDDLRRDLAKDFEVKTFSFGEGVREGLDTTFKDKISDISGMLGYLQDVFAGENLGAVIVASDGIYNEGANPVYSGEKLGVPIFSIALGDTTPRRDVILKRVFHNKIAYLGDQFTVQLDIAASNCSGTQTSLNVYQIEGSGQRLLQQLPITIDQADFFATRELTLNAERSGVQRYRLTLQSVSGEVTTANNTQDIFVDVLDARQKILILAQAPHPDLTALRQSLDVNKNYQVTVADIRELSVKPADFDLVILHQLPGRNDDASAVFTALNAGRTPRLFITGSQTNYPRFNQVQDLVTVRTDGRNTTDAQGRIAPNFGLFTVEDVLNRDLANYPPLTAPFGEFQTGAGGQVFLYQRIRKIDTQYPLLMLGEVSGIRTGVLLGEGIWKWRLFNFLQDENHLQFDSFLGKVIQYLSVKDDKRKFRVSVTKTIFNENEQATFNAELYNNSFELINEPDVRMVISDESGKEYNYVFNREGKAYQLNAGSLPVGNYRFRARVMSSGEELTFDGQFSVQPIQLELYETTADHNLLGLLSKQFGGSLVYPAQINTLAAQIRALDTVKPVVYQSTTTRTLLSVRWLFALLALLLFAEWFLRRYFGSY